VETMLDFVNLPSKRDIRDLKSRLDTLSSQLVNLSMKIDRMLAAEEPPRIHGGPSGEGSESGSRGKPRTTSRRRRSGRSSG
jgi:hypothetical protein